MKIKIIIYSLGFLLIVSCGENRTKIENAEYANFSDLAHIEYPDIELFDNYTSLPISISNGDFLDHNSILFLTESANVVPIERENLKKLLPKTEYEELITKRCEQRTDSLICSKEYFAYGRIVKPNYILLEYGIREYGDWGRHYVFEFRTYKPNGELISKIDFAKWSDKDDEFFEGKLIEGMNIELTKNEQIISKYHINENGKIKKR
ncbi:MAG: hypothetical protein RJQ09_11750 [Cyclobacteriaceae bacterium]